MIVTVIPIVIGALGTVTKGLIQGVDDLEIRRQVETIQTSGVNNNEDIKCILCGELDEKVNHMINKSIKIAQKQYKHE